MESAKKGIPKTLFLVERRVAAAGAFALLSAGNARAARASGNTSLRSFLESVAFATFWGKD